MIDYVYLLWLRHQPHGVTGNVASAQDWAKAQVQHANRHTIKTGNVAGLETIADRAAKSGASERTQRMADRVARMTAQIIPFPHQEPIYPLLKAAAAKMHKLRPLSPLECDPIFHAWCAKQDEQAKRDGQSLPFYDDLKARYLRGDR